MKRYVITLFALGAAATVVSLDSKSTVPLLIVVVGALIQVAARHNDQKP